MPSIKDLNVKPGDTIILQEGETYSLCSCGKSALLPFCDGSHKELAPDYKSIKVTVTRGGALKLYDE